MSPRIIPIPLSGDLRKAQAKGVRHADGLHDTYFEQSKLIRSAAEAKIREAHRLECEAWNALMWAWATGEMRPVIDDRQANPTIGRAVNGGYDLLEAKCKRCLRLSLVSLRDIRRIARISGTPCGLSVPNTSDPMLTRNEMQHPTNLQATAEALSPDRATTACCDV